MSKLGMHWMRIHPDGNDLAHVEAMQYKSVKVFEWHWSDRGACRDLLTVLPKDSYILARDHPLSEQEIWSDPVGIGTRHANEWAEKVRSDNFHLPTDRTFFLGRNEPDATNGDRAAIDRYTAAFLNRLKFLGLRGGAFNFSTGHPRTVDGTGNTQADYSVFEQSHRAIVDGNHIGVLHIYGTANVPCAPGHYDRLKACTWQDVQWVVGECGADEHVVGGGNHDGYLISVANLARYCAWLDELIIGINDPRIHSYQVFTYDFSHPWSSFNVREIRHALEGYQWRHTQQVTPPVTIHLPSIEAPQPAPVAPSGDTWQRSREFVRRWEGEWADNPADPGGATNKGITLGTYTRWRKAHGQPEPTKDDLRAITDAEADRIFFEWYWLESGSDKLPWPLCLAHFDTAVNAGPGRAAEMMQKSGGNFLAYVAELLDWYTRISNFEHFGRAWTRRRADLLREAAK